jgi:polygalacturonase
LGKRSDQPVINRREFLSTVLAGAASLMATRDASALRLAGSDGGWSELPSLLQRIKAPVFPKRVFSVVKFGARGDDRSNCTAAFRDAITECSAAGGGRVVVPPGAWLTGPIHLKSNVNLHLSRGAIIKFSRRPEDYMPLVFSRWEGVELMNYSPLIYAFEQQNIAITGEGTLDGQAGCQYWWPWKGRSSSAECPNEAKGPDQADDRRALFDMAEKGKAVVERVFGAGHYLRPQFIQPYHCQNVLIDGLTIRNSPMWEIHPVLCTNVIIRRVRIESHGPNNDGCNPESCRDVLIEDCYFDTGDDCIAIKSGRNADGRRLNIASENIVVRGCRMKDGHGGVTIGSEISGGVRNVFAYNCRMDSPNLERAIRFKNNAARGGLIEHVYARDLEVGQVSDAVVSIDFNYEEGARGGFIPVVRDVRVSNVKSRASKYALYLRGLDRAPISRVRLENCDFDNVAQENVVEHVNGLSLEKVRINGRPATGG